MEEIVCRPMPDCASGLATARGVFFGEHAWITREAMRRAGLGALAEGPAIPKYYSPRRPLRVGTEEFASYEPSAAGRGMQVLTERLNTVAEFAHIPDWSWSVFDYLLGNEHCFLNDVAREPLERIQACHQFTTHMGPANSTHFPPQARAVYLLYHRIALDLAVRCSELADTLREDASVYPAAAQRHLPAGLRDYLQKTVLVACEREAMAFEAIATHYSGDAWSSGHMWQRWGMPDYPGLLPLPFQPLKEGRQWFAVALGAWSGIQHGWRAVAAGTLKLAGRDAEHDRLCMPGPFYGVDQHEVQWKYPGQDTLHSGAGDDYLFPCKGLYKTDAAGKPLPIWALTNSPVIAEKRLNHYDKPVHLMGFQSERMLDCLAAGFRRTYNAGPRLQTDGAPLPDGPIADPDDERCWTQRVTNRSFYLGTGMSAWPASRSPAFYARVMIHRILREYGASPDLVDRRIARYLDRLSRAVRISMTAQQTRVAFLGLTDPEGTQLAELEGAVMGSLLTFGRNSEYVDRINHHRVSYLERPVSRWTTRPLEARCTSDADCPIDSWCGATPTEDGARHCIPKEAAIVQAFRPAHLTELCAEDDEAAMRAATGACLASGDRASVACDACVEVVLPKLRNACDEQSWMRVVPALAEGDDKRLWHGSLCDYAGVEPAAPVYEPYDPSDVGDARRAARDHCARPPIEASAEEPSYAHHRDPPSLNSPMGLSRVGTLRGNICGAGYLEAREPSWTFHHDRSEEHEDKYDYRFVLTAPRGASGKSPIKDLEFGLYLGDCTQRIIAATAPKDLNGDGVAEAYELTWSATKPDQYVCVRVKAGGYRVSTPYQLAVSVGGVDLAEGEVGIYTAWIEVRNACAACIGAELDFRAEPQDRVRHNRGVHSSWSTVMISREGSTFSRPNVSRTFRSFVGLEPTHLAVRGKCTWPQDQRGSGTAECAYGSWFLQLPRSRPAKRHALVRVTIGCKGEVSCSVSAAPKALGGPWMRFEE